MAINKQAVIMANGEILGLESGDDSLDVGSATKITTRVDQYGNTTATVLPKEQEIKVKMVAGDKDTGGGWYGLSNNLKRILREGSALELKRISPDGTRDTRRAKCVAGSDFGHGATTKELVFTPLTPPKN